MTALLQLLTLGALAGLARQQTTQGRKMADTTLSNDQKLEKLATDVTAIKTGVADIKTRLKAIQDASNDTADETKLSHSAQLALDAALASADAIVTDLTVPTTDPTEPTDPVV